MVVYLEGPQLTQALQRVKSWEDQAPYSWRLIGCLHSQIDMDCGHIFIVDQWPQFKAICTLPNKKCICWFFFDVVYQDGKEDGFLEKFLFDSKLWEVAKPLENATIHWAVERTGILDDLCRFKNLTGTNDETFAKLVSDERSLIPQSIPVGYVLGVLTKEDIPVVHKNWVLGREDNVEFVRSSLVHFPSVALRDSKGHLVGWYATYYIGEMGMLTVLEEHRGKGLAKCLIYELAKKLFALKRYPYSYVDVNNMPSVKSHESCGFLMAPFCDTYYKDLLKTK